MSSLCRYSKATVFSFAAVLAVSVLSEASAAKRLSYEQAWTQCKKDIGGSSFGENLNTGGRYAAGGACMQKYGYRLKRAQKANSQ